MLSAEVPDTCDFASLYLLLFLLSSLFSPFESGAQEQQIVQPEGVGTWFFRLYKAWRTSRLARLKLFKANSPPKEETKVPSTFPHPSKNIPTRSLPTRPSAEQQSTTTTYEDYSIAQHIWLGIQSIAAFALD